MSRFAVFCAFWALLGVGCAREVPALPLAPVALFEGRVENGQLVYLRTTPVAASTSSTEQGLSVVPEDRNGVRGTSDIDAAVELTTENGNGFPAPTLTPDGCGAGIDAFDVFAGLRNFHDVDLGSVHIEILSLSGDSDDHSLCNSDAPSPNLLVDGTTPLDDTLGLIRYGHDERDANGFATAPTAGLVPRPFGADTTARARRWRFRNGGGSFGFRGRVLANRCDDDCTPGVAINEGPGAPVGSRPFPTVNGTVLAVVEGDGVVYLGGSFTTVNPRTTAAIFTAKNSAQTGTLLSTHPDLEGGVVDSVVGDGAGGFYVGGTFTTVDGTNRPRLVHVLSSGAVDTTFTPATSTTGTISALALDAARNTLWVGRTAAPFLAVVSATTGAEAGLTLTAPGDEVHDILVSGTDVFIAGQFENYGGNGNRDKLARLSAVNGSVNGATYNGITTGSDVEVSCIARQGDTIYVGGDFQSPRNRAAAFPVNGGNRTNWNPNLNGQVFAIATTSSDVYLGGNFTTLANGNEPRQRVAATALAGGTVRAWSPNPNGSVVNSLVVDGGDVYVVGDFTTIAGQTRNQVAVVDGNVGSGTPTVRGYAPFTSAGTTRQIALSGSTVAIGGDEQSFEGAAIARLAAVDLATMQFLPIDANIADGEVRTLHLSGGRLYAGGTFTSVGGETHNRAVAFVPETLAVDPTFDIDMGGFTFFVVIATGHVNDIATTDDHVYFAGDFSSVNGTTQVRFARTDLNGVLDETYFPSALGFAGFQLRTTNIPNSAANAVSLVANGDAYFGGSFTNLGNQTAAGNRLVRLTTTGAVAQNLNADGAVNTLVASPNGREIYVGGTFDNVAGSPRNRIAAIEVASNALTALNPGGFDGTVLTMDLRGHSLVLGGTFGAPFSGAAAVDVDAGSIVTDFSPLTVTTGAVRAVGFVGNSVVIGGDFSGTVDVAGDPAGTPRLNTAMVFAE